MGAHAPQHFVWDGRTAAGALAPDGVYHPWVHLAHARRTFRFANNITVDTTAAQGALAPGVGKPVLFAGPGRSVAIKYTFRREGARARLPRQPADHRRPQDRAAATRSSGRDGSAAGRFPRGGTSSRSVRRISPATRRPPAERKHVTVVLRYIELTPEQITVRSGRRFTVHVETAARRYTWRLGHRHGARHGKVLRLRAPTTPGHVPARRDRERARRDRRRAGAREVIGLAEIAGPIACIGLAVLLLARTRRNRIAGLCYAGVGTVLLAVSLAPTNAAEIGAAVGGVIVLGPLLAWLFRREPWLVAFATLAFVPFRIGFLGHSLLVPLYAVALGAAGLLLWQLVEGDERTRELGIVSWPLALYLVWIGFSVGWSVDVHSAAIDLLAFYVPFTILAVSIARLPWRTSRVRILYGELVAMALVFAVVGFYQYETKTIFQNAKLHQSNIFEALFRVNSVFFDPSIYGRFLVVALIATAVLIVRGAAVSAGRPGRAGVHSPSRGSGSSSRSPSRASRRCSSPSSRWPPIVWRWKSLFALAAVLVVAAGIAVAQPQLMHALRHHTTSGLNHATSGRATLIAVGIKIAEAHPSHGVGLGGFEHAYSKRTHKQAEAERLAQHAGDRRRGGGRARPPHLLLARRGAAARRVPADQARHLRTGRARGRARAARDLRPLARLQRLLRGSDHLGADRPGRARLAATGAGARAGASGADGARA